MKKFLNVLASFSMMSILLTGCGNTNTPASVETATPAPTEVATIADEDIHIIYFNDFHGNVAEEVTGKKRNMGMAKMVGYVNEYKTTHPNTIVVSGGDNYQGTSESNLTVGKPVTAMMKGMHVVASAVGNHEFDWGEDKINEWEKEGNFDYLASNIEKDGTPVDWAKPYMIQEIGGKKIAFVGLAHPDTPTLTKASNVEGLTFTDPIEAANKWVEFLKNGEAEEGTPEAIILLTHIDSVQDQETNEITGNAVDLAEQVKDIDCILSAHSHRTVNGLVNNVPVIQASKYGRAIGVVDLAFNDEKPEVTCNLFMGKDIKDDIIEDDEQLKLRDELEEELAPIMNEKLGTASEDIVHSRETKGTNTPLGHWACEAIAKEVNAQVAIQNGGGLRRSLLKGDITMGDMYEIMPFDNNIVVFDLPGKDLIWNIDHGINMPESTDGAFSGLIVEYDSSKPYNEQITKITLEDGTPIDPDKDYRVATNDCVFTGGDGYDFSNAKNIEEPFIKLRDVFVEDVKTKGELTPDTIDYIKDVNE